MKHGCFDRPPFKPWHQEQRSVIPRSQYEGAIRLTSARIKSGHATVDLLKTLGAPKK